MKIPTLITEMLGIDLPIIGAPMFLVSYPDLVVSVSEAGGIGTFPAFNYRSQEALRDALTEIRSRTKKPIGVNILLHNKLNPDAQKQLDVCLEFNVELIITSMGTPRSILKEIKDNGTKVFADITTLRQGKILEKIGVDALVAVAQGAGGNTGAISPLSFIPYLKAETKLPVVAAGSIGTGRQMLAAMALGADAVYVGTRFIASHEASAKDEYKAMLISEKPEDIENTDKITGFSSNWLKKSIAGLKDSGEQNEVKKRNWKDIFSAGHGIAQIKEIKSVPEIMNSITKEYLQVLESGLPQLSKK